MLAIVVKQFIDVTTSLNHVFSSRVNSREQPTIYIVLLTPPNDQPTTLTPPMRYKRIYCTNKLMGDHDRGHAIVACDGTISGKEMVVTYTTELSVSAARDRLGISGYKRFSTHFCEAQNQLCCTYFTHPELSGCSLGFCRSIGATSEALYVTGMLQWEFAILA